LPRSAQALAETASGDVAKGEFKSAPWRTGLSQVPAHPRSLRALKGCDGMRLYTASMTPNCRIQEGGSTASADARWEHFPHDADVGVRGYGTTKAEAFEQAALALCAVVTDPASVALRQ